MQLAERIYQLTATYPKSETYGLIDQSRRAVVSIACNIAEGSGRRTTTDLVHFLVLSRSSLRELDTLYELAIRLKYATPSEEINRSIQEIGKMLNGLIRTLKSKAPIK